MRTKHKIIQEFNRIAAQENLLPIQVSPFYQKKIDEEIKAIGYNGPLYKGSYPTAERLTVRAPGEVPDFVQDNKNMPQGLKNILVQKYPDRVLLLFSEKCIGHCQYCFRTYVLSQEHLHPKAIPSFENKLNLAIDYVNHHPDVKEIIFSGGDPLSLNPVLLETAFRRFRRETAIRDLRIHTRAIVYAPIVFRDRINEILANYAVRLYFHIMHPYEICDVVADTIKKIRSFGIKTYNQFPLLRNINDHAEVLTRHLRFLDELGIRQTTMFIPDPINYSASFRIPLERLFGIIDELNWQTPSWINSGRVVLDTPIGKVRRENIIAWNRETGVVTFERDGQQISYRDFPKELDKPGDITKMLWKG